MAYRRRYHWPEFQLNIWIILNLAGSATCLGIFAWFLTVQAQLELGMPWYVPFHITYLPPTKPLTIYNTHIYTNKEEG